MEFLLRYDPCIVLICMSYVCDNVLQANKNVKRISLQHQQGIFFLHKVAKTVLLLNQLFALAKLKNIYFILFILFAIAIAVLSRK